MREIFHFDKIYYNEVVYWLEMQWGRKLDEHERNVLIEGYRYGRTMQMLDQSLSEYHKLQSEERNELFKNES